MELAGTYKTRAPRSRKGIEQKLYGGRMPGIIKNQRRSQGSWSRVSKGKCGTDVVRNARGCREGRSCSISPITRTWDVTVTETERHSRIVKRGVI